MDEDRFQDLADETLNDLMERIESVADDDTEVDLEGGILTIELGSGAQYLVNKHAPNRQIWVSSPRSGAAHFSYDSTTERWSDTRNGGDLRKNLSRELASDFNRTVDLG